MKKPKHREIIPPQIFISLEKILRNNDLNWGHLATEGVRQDAEAKEWEGKGIAMPQTLDSLEAFVKDRGLTWVEFVQEAERLEADLKRAKVLKLLKCELRELDKEFKLESEAPTGFSSYLKVAEDSIIKRPLMTTEYVPHTHKLPAEDSIIKRPLMTDEERKFMQAIAAGQGIESGGWTKKMKIATHPSSSDILGTADAATLQKGLQMSEGAPLSEGTQETLGTRFNQGKPKLSYVNSAPAALVGLAQVFAFGAEIKGYGKNNWKKGLSFSGLIDSLDRHKLSFFNGQDLDEESQLPHVDHILWNALILSEMYYTRKDMDDRQSEGKL